MYNVYDNLYQITVAINKIHRNWFKTSIVTRVIKLYPWNLSDEYRCILIKILIFTPNTFIFFFYSLVTYMENIIGDEYII